jgi:hypothetical protein
VDHASGDLAAIDAAAGDGVVQRGDSDAGLHRESIE